MADIAAELGDLTGKAVFVWCCANRYDHSDGHWSVRNYYHISLLALDGLDSQIEETTLDEARAAALAAWYSPILTETSAPTEPCGILGVPEINAEPMGIDP